ncbi:restriction endonuclease subunit S [Streptomyces sp. NPDC051815]|uniref:restriction endonuclease subunit S n=1 Tax=Streptomyces sp. NPDC051815 TaxID=3365674 RepID=UPI00379C8E37
MPRIDELFDVQYGNKLDMNKMVPDPQGIAFVGRKGTNQGVSGYVAELPGVLPYVSGLLTVALGGSRLLATFVQQAPFYTAQNVAVLSPRDPGMGLQQRLFYAACIAENRFRYTAFGREANRTLATIDLPSAVPGWVSETSIPDVSDIARSVDSPIALSDNRNWGIFCLDDLFEIKKGRRLTKRDRVAGYTPFVSASAANNGITDLIDRDPQFPAGVLTVPYNGNSVGWSFYQDEPFAAGDDVQVLVPREQVDKFALMFVAAILRFERARFTYGYKWHLERMRGTSVRLPALASGAPDWGYMARYIRGLPLASAV